MTDHQIGLLHNEAVVIDGHCDTVHLFSGIKGPYAFAKKNQVGHVDLPRLREGGVDIQFFALYIEEEHKRRGALERTLTLMEHFWREMEQIPDDIRVIQSAYDLDQVMVGQMTGAILALEGAEGLESTEILSMLYRMGLRSVGLTWNQRNHLADGVGVGLSAGGLTSLGKEMVREMNRLGILTDVAHVAARGFYDIMEITDQPVIVSHANASAVFSHPRNLSDDQLRALKENGGVVGLTYYPTFISGTQETGLDKLLDHFSYIAEKYGTGILGLGSDFDGISRTVTELSDISKLPLLTAGLLRRGFSVAEVKQILGGNFLRVIRQTLMRGEAGR
jgi:membrane dipeptidase